MRTSERMDRWRSRPTSWATPTAWSGAATSTGNTFTGPQNGTGVDLGNGEMPVALTITAESKANPTEITTNVAHGMVTGDTVTITGSNFDSILRWGLADHLGRYD